MEELEVGSLYSVKEGKTVCKTEEILTKYVLINGFASNPLIEDEWFVEFIYVFDWKNSHTRCFSCELEF